MQITVNLWVKVTLWRVTKHHIHIQYIPRIMHMFQALLWLTVLYYNTEMVRSTGWKPLYSLETKTSFNVSSEYQGCQPDDFSVSMKWIILQGLMHAIDSRNLIYKEFIRDYSMDKHSHLIVLYGSHPWHCYICVTEHRAEVRNYIT